MKHLEETPWYICDEEDINYCAYVDTDSNYFNAEPLLKHLNPNFEELSDEEKDSKLEKIALYYQDYISNHYDNLARTCFNVEHHRLEMKTEAVIRSAYFRAPRRYAQWITKQSIIENLNFFKNLSREEIYADRKSKFLKIGRDKGFIKSSNFKDRGLSYEEPLIQKTIRHIILNKYTYGGISLIIMIGIITIFN